MTNSIKSCSLPSSELETIILDISKIFLSYTREKMALIKLKILIGETMKL